MAEKKKSIIEEALLEAKSLEDALKANTKEMLAAHLSKELESIVESSLKDEKKKPVEEEEEDDAKVKGSVDEEEDVEDDLKDETEDEDEDDSLEFDDLSDNEDEDIELDLDSEPNGKTEETPVDLDLDTDLDLDAGEGSDTEEFDLDLELPSDGSEEVLDLTGASDAEVVKVFKRLSDEDEVEVVKDADGIHLTDNKTGAEYYIKESMNERWGSMKEEDEYCSECGSGSMYEDEEEDESEVVYEIELSDDSPMMEMFDDLEEGHYIDEEEEQIEEDLARTRGYARQGNRRHGASHIPSRREESRFSESRKITRKPVVDRKPKTNTVSESKIMKEYNELKAKNEEYKKALNVFKDKLNEVALFNTNLAYVNRLFTEHSTTKKEKMDILKRFDSAESIKESKNIYKTIKTELDNKKPMNESIDKKVIKTIESSKSTNLNESTAYVDPQITAIKDLMRRIS
jgi:hypothetical protein